MRGVFYAKGERMALYYPTREENLSFLKRLWAERETPCPRCGAAALVLLHRKAKRSNTEWKCPACGEIYRTIHMLDELNEKFQ
jgi:predicted RNA-binding Zn-ribbon protein involved in translation (DUF1610 family)